MRLVDSHCHLQDELFDGDREQVLARALDDLDWLVVIGDDVEGSRAGIALCRERVYATVGIHPHKAVRADRASLDAIAALAANPGVVAFGEIGLDYHYHFSPRDRQWQALQLQVELAATLRLPVVVHCREAESDLAAIIEPARKDLIGGVMHCFGGDAAFAERCLSWGFYISFAGNVTYPKADRLRTAADATPLDRFLVETDSPYLAPKPVRGQRCEPAFVQYTADFLAQRRNVSFEEFADQTTRNARRVFGLCWKRDLGPVTCGSR
jgi:TatD DNase family protein